MAWGDVLIILGCLAAGYWIVGSIVGKGIDIIDADSQAKDSEPGTSAATPSASPMKPLPAPPPMHDWHIVLDVPRDASRSDIEAAFKRRRAQAQDSGDHAAIERLQRAIDAGRKVGGG